MKRFLKCLFAMMMVVGLSACSNSEQEQEAIKVVIDSYLGNCKSGDYESADAFLSKDAGSDLEFAAVYSELDSQLESMGLGEDFDREARSCRISCRKRSWNIRWTAFRSMATRRRRISH